MNYRAALIATALATGVLASPAYALTIEIPDPLTGSNHHVITRSEGRPLMIPFMRHMMGCKPEMGHHPHGAWKRQQGQDYASNVPPSAPSLPANQ